MLKTVALLEKSISDKLEIVDSEGGDNISGDSMELTKKSGKSKSQNLAKF